MQTISGSNHFTFTSKLKHHSDPSQWDSGFSSVVRLIGIAALKRAALLSILSKPFTVSFIHDVRSAGNFTRVQAPDVRRGTFLQRRLRVYVVHVFTGVLSLGSRFQGHERRCAAAGRSDRGRDLHSARRL